jgi:hypothetical protein
MIRAFCSADYDLTMYLDTDRGFASVDDGVTWFDLNPAYHLALHLMLIGAWKFHEPTAALAVYPGTYHGQE